MIFLIDRIDKQGPTILQVGNHHHADNAKQELPPARCVRRCGGWCSRCNYHLLAPDIFVFTVFARMSDALRGAFSISDLEKASYKSGRMPRSISWRMIISGQITRYSPQLQKLEDRR